MCRHHAIAAGARVAPYDHGLRSEFWHERALPCRDQVGSCGVNSGGYHLLVELPGGTMSPPEGRPMKRRTRPFTGSIQVERQASIAGS